MSYLRDKDGISKIGWVHLGRVMYNIMAHNYNSDGECECVKVENKSIQIFSLMSAYAEGKGCIKYQS